MTVSIFTPTHDSSFLPEVWKSIRAQPFLEWVIVYNNGAKVLDFGDDRVKAHILPVASEWVGPLKAYACSLCRGDILLELDHDDLLLPGAIEAVARAFDDPAVGLVYSNAVHATGDYKATPRFADGFGWECRAYNWQGHVLDEYVSFDPAPSAVSRIWYAPDHLRAFRKSAYEAVGGHSRTMRVLDDLDLMCRLYQVCRFKHIDQPLYLYRVHGANTWLKHNGEIQENVLRIHDQYIEPMAAAWAKRAGLRCLDLGGRFDCQAGYESVDLRDAEVVADLNQPWPFESGSVGAIRAYDIFEHLRSPLHVMKEVYRVLAPGGLAFIQVPSSDGRGAFADPTHVSYWNEASFQYWTQKRKARYIDTPVRFQAVRLYTTAHDADGVSWTRAHLLRLGEGMRVPGEVTI